MQGGQGWISSFPPVRDAGNIGLPTVSWRSLFRWTALRPHTSFSERASLCVKLTFGGRSRSSAIHGAHLVRRDGRGPHPAAMDRGTDAASDESFGRGLVGSRSAPGGMRWGWGTERSTGWGAARGGCISVGGRQSSLRQFGRIGRLRRRSSRSRTRRFQPPDLSERGWERSRSNRGVYGNVQGYRSSNRKFQKLFSVKCFVCGLR
jgi:hypothetical protein